MNPTLLSEARPQILKYCREHIYYPIFVRKKVFCNRFSEDFPKCRRDYARCARFSEVSPPLYP
ncbi:MAG: hypothetical protein ACJAZ7_000185 [Zhongshania aliphaticivorans]|jgi:hypothetical protein